MYIRGIFGTTTFSTVSLKITTLIITSFSFMTFITAALIITTLSELLRKKLVKPSVLA
jgi:hypothetical protein